MIAVPSQKLAIVIVTSVVGIAASLLTTTICGLLVPVAALFLCARGRATLLLNSALAILLVGSLLAVYFHAGAISSFSWPAFFASALCIGAIVSASAAVSYPGDTIRPADLNTTGEQTPPLSTGRAGFDETTAADVTSSLNLIHPDDRNAAAHAAARAFWTGVPQITRHRKLYPDGSYRWTETRSEPGYSVSVDIDDLVTEKEPQTIASISPSESEAEPIRSARVIESLFGNGWAFDSAGRWIFLHPFAQNSLGATLDDLNASLKEGHTAWKRLLHPDDYDRVAATWLHCLQTGDHFNVEFRFRRATGTYIWARTAARPTRDDQGRITGWFGIALDVDVYKKTVAALREREHELSHLVDMVPSHIWRLAPNGEPTFFNKRMVDFLGLDITDTDRPDKSRLESVIETVIHPDDATEFRDTLTSCFVTGEEFAMRYRLRRADGIYHWMSSRAEPMRDDAGRIVQWYGLCHDIDDQVHAEEALRKSEQQLRQLVDAVPASIWCTERDGTPTYRNKRHASATGAVLKDFSVVTEGYSSPLSMMAHPEDRAATERARARAFETGDSYVVRYRQIRSDGTYRWTESRAEPLRDDSGEVLQWYGVSVDIHDLIAAQEALRQSEQELSQLVNMLPVHIRRLSPEGKTIFFNKRLTDFVGMDLAELEQRGSSGLAETVQTLIHPDDAAGLQSTINHSLATGESYAARYRVRRADGVYRWMGGRGEPVRDQNGTIVQWYGISIDIDDEVIAQEALRKRERELQQLIDALPVHIWSWTPVGKLAYVNKRSLEDLGLSKANFEDFTNVGKTLIHPDDAPEVVRTSANCLKTGATFVMRYRRRWGDGNYRWIEARAQPLRDRDGTIVHWYQVSIDIDDEVRAQERLLESKRQLQQLIDALPTQIWAATAEGEPSYLNRRLAEYVGLTLNDLDVPDASRLQMAVQSSVHPDDAASVGRALGHAFTTGETFTMKYRQRRADGVYRWINGRAEPLRDSDGKIVHWYGVSFDIDDDVRTEDELRQTQERLAVSSQAASLAELSASIAHEVNQPLAAIVANSHACHRWLSAEPPNVDRAKITAERIIRDANSAADVVSRIRALFKQSIETRTGATLGSAIAEARNLMAEEAVRRRVVIDVDVERSLPLVPFDRVQLQQVLINLMRNGMDAMDSVTGDKVLRVRTRRAGDMIQTEIRDQGKGIEFPEKIFEPFFTTKEQGMGMGLAICRSIVESHGGRLWAEPNQPQGSTFIFTLPLEVKAAT